MANLRPLALLLAVLACALCRHANATTFEVGGDDGWVVPPASDGGRYNQWASKNRFLVGDLVRKRQIHSHSFVGSLGSIWQTPLINLDRRQLMHGPCRVQTSSTRRTR